MQSKTIDPTDIVSLGVPNYSHGALTSNATEWLHLSGQVGVNPVGSVSPDFEDQCRRAFSNIAACLRDAGMGFGDVVMLRIYLIDRSDLQMLRNIRSEFFGDRCFPSTLVIVSGLVDPAWRVELEIIAAV
ncbi:MAG: RidA family protein [Paracoccaceae bacterium]|nr:RidA family protein [Paracoccaceae bacterium]